MGGKLLIGLSTVDPNMIRHNAAMKLKDTRIRMAVPHVLAQLAQLRLAMFPALQLQRECCNHTCDTQRMHFIIVYYHVSSRDYYFSITGSFCQRATVALCAHQQ